MKKETTQHHILFDIDSSSVGVVVFELFQNKKTKKQQHHIIFSKRNIIDVGTNTDIDFFFKKTLSVFHDTATQAHKNSGNIIANISINVSAPWLSSQKRIVHFEKNKEFIFTQKIADTMINDEIKEDLHHTLDFKDYKNLEIIERKTIDFYQNGYPTKKPLGKKIKDADIHSLISVISTDTKKQFIHVIERVFHIDEVEFISNIFMSYWSLLQLYPNENNLVHFDMSAKITEIMVIINDHLFKIGTIPVGADFIIKNLAEKLHISPVKAESLIVMYQNNNLDKKYRDNIETAMENTFMAWFKHFYSFLNEVSLEEIVPSTLSILAPDFIQGWLSEWMLKTGDITQHIHAHKKVSLLNIKKTLSDDIAQDINLSLCLEFLLLNN